MQLQQRGVDLLVNVLDSTDHVEKLTHADIRRLLTEVAQVMSLILEREAEVALNGDARARRLVKIAWASSPSRTIISDGEPGRAEQP